MKINYFLLLFLLTIITAQSQTVNIPDTNFKNALINTNCVDTDDNGTYDSDADLNNDGEIQVSEAELVTSLNVSFQSITSLEGISSFINLTIFYCTDNPLIELDVSSLVNLQVLGCWDNDQITTLDLSSNVNLTSVECDSNDALEFVNLQNGNNENIVRLWADNMANLQCIQVDDENYANSQICGGDPISWCKESITIYSENCSLGIPEYNNYKVTFYPNPTNGRIIIDSKLEIENVKVYSILGKLKLDTIVLNNNLDLTNLESGIYFIMVQSKDRIVTKKIVKK